MTCAVLWCKNQSYGIRNFQGVTFHKFVNPGHPKREAWVEFVRKSRDSKKWEPSNHQQICTDHFKDEDKVVKKNGLVYLKTTAVPYDPIDLEPRTPELLEEFDFGVGDSSLAPPQVLTKLKHKLRKEIAARRVLARKYKKLHSEHRYFKEKFEFYESMVKDIKTKLIYMHLRRMNKSQLEELHKEFIKNE